MYTIRLRAAGYADALAQTPRGLSRAIALLEESLAHLPQDEDLAIQLAELLQKKGDYHRALAVLEPLAETAPRPDLLRLLSDSYGEAGRAATGRSRTARRATELAPEQIDLWLNLADRARDADKPNEAVEAASKAVALNDQNLTAWVTRMVAHDLCENWAEALDDAEHAVRLVESRKTQSDYLEPLKFCRVWYLWQAKGVDAARAQFRADLALHPSLSPLKKG